MIHLLRALFAVLLLLFPLYLRVMVEARNHLEQGIELYENGQWQAAAAAFRKSLSWRSPLNGYADQAEMRLNHLAADPALSNEQQISVKQELYRGLMSSRSIFNDRSTRDRISALEAELLGYARSVAGSDIVRPQYPARVDFGAQLAAQGALWAWIVFMVGTIWWGFAPSGELRMAQFCSGLVLAFGAFSAWLYLLGLA